MGLKYEVASRIDERNKGWYKWAPSRLPLDLGFISCLLS